MEMLSELINVLQDELKAHGDLKVAVSSMDEGDFLIRKIISVDKREVGLSQTEFVVIVTK